MAMCDRIPHVRFHKEGILEENKEVNMLPTRIIEKLRKEAGEWDAAIQAESPQKVQAMMDQAEPFVASRPVRLPVSLRMDPFDIAMLKRVNLTVEF